MKTFNKNFTQSLSIIITLLFLLSSCAKKDDYVEVVGEARLKIVNTVQGSDPQDFYQNDKKISTTAISYGQFSDYLTIIAGTSTTITLKSNISSQVSATSFIAPQLGNNFTVFYYSSPTGVGMISGLPNDISTPAAGKIKVRFLNLGLALQNTLNINTSNGALLISGLAYNYSSQYQLIDDNLGLSVKVLGSTDELVIPNSAFITGKNYTVWFDATNSTTPNYHVVLEN